MKMNDHQLRWLFGILSFFTLGYVLFSFSLTDPNLTLTSWFPYAEFQNRMWQTFFLNAQLLTLVYTLLITGLLGTYTALIVRLMRATKTQPLSWQTIWTVVCWLCFLLLFSYNALSHDVFNYMFNAKMVVTYQANPHTQVALDFAQDPWTRFMHNTHTPAPYGYGWTSISVIPYWLTAPIQHRFLPTWLLYRVLSVISFIATLAVLRWARKKLNHETSSNWMIALFALSPLVLIEIISNNHNDLWMMAPAVGSLTLIAKSKRMGLSIFSLILLIASVSIKLATLTLAPLWIGLTLQRWLPKKWQEGMVRFWPLLASICLFIPLITARSQQFHSWYLVWVFVWLPLFGVTKKVSQTSYSWIETAWSIFIVALSFTSLYRYMPWLLNGYFTDAVVWQQKLITWVPAVIVGSGWVAFQLYLHHSPRSQATNTLE